MTGLAGPLLFFALYYIKKIKWPKMNIPTSKDCYFKISAVETKIQQTMMLVTCQRFGNLFLFGLVWQYSSLQTKYNKGRFKIGLVLSHGYYLLAAVI